MSSHTRPPPRPTRSCSCGAPHTPASQTLVDLARSFSKKRIKRLAAMVASSSGVTHRQIRIAPSRPSTCPSASAELALHADPDARRYFAAYRHGTPPAATFSASIRQLLAAQLLVHLPSRSAARGSPTLAHTARQSPAWIVFRLHNEVLDALGSAHGRQVDGPVRIRRPIVQDVLLRTGPARAEICRAYRSSSCPASPASPGLIRGQVRLHRESGSRQEHGRAVIGSIAHAALLPSGRANATLRPRAVPSERQAEPAASSRRLRIAPSVLA